MKPVKSFVVIYGIIAVTGWLIFFGLGLFISSKPFRDMLGNGLNWYALFVSLVTYTPTNIAFLCMAASFCGGCSNNLFVTKKILKDGGEEIATNITLQQNPFNCIIRGFVVYIAFLAGMYILVNSPFENPTPEQYAKAAGVISILAYVVGYDQANFLNLLSLTSKLRKE
jgi:hypothetical protein